MLMKSKKITAFAALLLSATLVNAATVTFEDTNMAAVQINPASPGFVSGGFTSGGFNFTFNAQSFAITNAQVCFPDCPVNGSNIVVLAYGPSLFQMTKTDGGNFDLLGFDGTGSFNLNQSWLGNRNIPDQINVVAKVADGTQVTQSFLIDKSAQSGPLAFSSYSLSGSFTNLNSVIFSSSGAQDNDLYNGLSIDNISTSAVPNSAVPEPTTVTLLGLGLLGVAASRRKPANSKNA